MSAGGEDIDGAGRLAGAVNRDTKAGYDRRHERELACRKQ
jgi:hypothetical protein